MLGEQFMVGEEICGAVVSVRFQVSNLRSVLRFGRATKYKIPSAYPSCYSVGGYYLDMEQDSQ